MFLTSVLKLLSSWYLSGSLQLNLGCLQAGLPVLGAVCVGLAFSAHVSAFLNVIIAALVASVTACIGSVSCYLHMPLFLTF